MEAKQKIKKMKIYDKKKIMDAIRKIMDTEFEKMYPFELEKVLEELGKQAKENKDDETLKIIRWEYALLNATYSTVVLSNGKKINEISNKWKSILLNKRDINSNGEISAREVEHEPENKTVYLQPLSNLPFCEWQEESNDYYRKRYKETKSDLSKARYAFAILIFSKGKDRLDWMKKTVDCWIKTAEKYVNDNKYSEFFEMPPFAYEFALKLTSSFGDKELARKVLDSLHLSIIKILDDGEKKWYIEFLEVESKYIHQFDNATDMINDSVKNVKEIITRLEQDLDENKDKQKTSHFLRHHLRILISYKTEDEFDLNKRIAESYFSEAEWLEAPLVKSSFYNDAVKKYKLMESKFPMKKEEIKKRIDEITLKLKEVNPKIEYGVVQTSFTIKKQDIDTYIEELRTIDKDLFRALLSDNSLFPEFSVFKSETENQKKWYPLSFLIPVVVYNKEVPIMKHVLEEKIFDYRLRENILVGIKMAELMIKMTFKKLEEELNIKTFEKADELLKIDELKDIYPTLQKGFYSILGETRDSIVGLHIIVPYFEEIIRRIIKKVGKVDVVLQSHNTRYFRGIELGALLADEEVGKLIDSNFQKSLKILLVDNDQTNLRNELMHGRWESDKIEEAEVLFVGYCLLKLIKILKDTHPAK